MATGARRDEQYYEVVRPGSLAEILALKARDRIYADFLRICAPEAASSILDVGVSDVITSAANFLERLYPHPDRITAVGLGEAHDFAAAFPAIRYVQIAPQGRLPFSEDAFSIATSNAVLEHVGALEHQHRFVEELARVARKVFISVPNRYFPVEPHTGIPLLHFWDATFQPSCRALGKAKWALPENLIMMTLPSLARLAPAGVRAQVGTSGLRLGTFSSNLFLYLEK
jgi:hypothetical protein